MTFWLRNATFCLLLAALAVPCLAAHGKLSTNERDAWINGDLAALADSGLVRLDGRDPASMDNLQVARLTQQAGEFLMAQAPAGAASPSVSEDDVQRLKRLAAEFKEELSALGADLPEWEERLTRMRRENGRLGGLQEEHLKRTGARIGGFSKGFFDQAVESPDMIFSATGFVEVQLKAVPAPFLSFDGRFRATRTFGQYFDAPTTELRWIQLNAEADGSTFTVGDHWESYTPLVLWNDDVQKTTLFETTIHERLRKEDGERSFMDRAPEWRLRGLRARIRPVLGEGAGESLEFRAMAGRVTQATDLVLGSYYVGGFMDLTFFDEAAFLRASGLWLWSDRNTSSLAYLAGDPTTYERQYRVGSVTPGFRLEVAPKAVLEASAELATGVYVHDWSDPDLDLSDWAMVGKAALEVAGVRLEGKYLNVGPFFYSPGAQNASYDHAAGYRPGFPFMGMDLPSFAVYDRLRENIFPYGESTPNREAWVGSLSAKLGSKGWIRPEAVGTLASEMQANFVRDGLGNDVAAEDLTGTIFPVREFIGLDGALILELAGPLALGGDRTFNIGGGYKWQRTELNEGLEGLETDIASLGTDFSLPIPGFEGILLSAGAELGRSNGNEFATSVGSSLVAYPSYYVMPLASWSYQSMDSEWTELAFGALFPLNPTVKFKADLLIRHEERNGADLYPRGRHFLRFTYEAAF